jgi:hypothetical protein
MACCCAAAQAQVTQQANLMAGKRSAPVWALAAILFLGWNEFMAVLWNPMYLILGAAMFLFGWQLYGELDVDAEMQRGPMVGLFNMWNKLGDGLRNVSGHEEQALWLVWMGAGVLAGVGVMVWSLLRGRLEMMLQGRDSIAEAASAVVHALRAQRWQHVAAGMYACTLTTLIICMSSCMSVCIAA